MAATNNLIPDFEDFERYHRGEMSSAEQRVLEGRMLAEPLVAEAYEGFLAWRAHGTSAGNVRMDLRERLHTRVSHTRRNILPLWAYASAASVLLAVFSYWFMFLPDQKAEIQINAATAKQEVKPSPGTQAPATTSIQQDKPLKSVGSAAAVSDNLAENEPAPMDQPNLTPKAQALPKPEIALAPSVLADEEVPEEAKDIALEDSFQIKTEAAPVPPRPAQTLVTPGAAQAVGKSMAGRARTEPEGVNKQYLVASQPVSAEKKAYTLVVPSDTLPPAPVGGWAAYHNYLDKNTGAASTTGQVVVTFFVSSTGMLSGFVARGAEDLHKDAIRIISSGPAWMPAHTKGMPVTSRTEIQLQFRQPQ